MKRLCSAHDHMLIGHLRQILENNAIRCVTKNEYLWGGVGELPPNECWPELWVLEDFQYEKAKALVDAVLSTSEKQGRAWRCSDCDEPIEGQFTECWKCGNSRPLVGD